MHRTLQITVPPDAGEALARELETQENVVGLSLSPGASIKPRGDMLTVQVLNRGIDDVLRTVARVKETGPVSVVTSETAAIIAPDEAERVSGDVDEAVWEEMVASLRHQGRIGTNYLLLMATGGALSAVGLVSEPTPQAIIFVAAACITPGFEPLAKIALGLVLRQGRAIRHGLWATLVGYALLIATAALTFTLLRALGATSAAAFIQNPEVQNIAHPSAKEVTVSVCGAFAGAVIVSAYRRSVIVGALIALVTIPAGAMIGVGWAAGHADFAAAGFTRLCLDFALIVGIGVLVFGLKQVLLHRRRPLD